MTSDSPARAVPPPAEPGPRDLDRLLDSIRVAERSRSHGNHPFGAVLTDAAGSVLLEAENTVVTTGDATGHAETNLVRLASRDYTPAELDSCTLYTSCEPCAMCSGAIYWSGIGRVVYALAEAELYAITGANPENPTMRLPCREVFAAGQRPTVVVGPAEALAAEARAVHDGFWV
ncbi:nucleoside deaminase [Microterricola pindariensis]|uniref:nucleoside deaminase n=1 Tax=Microterricola pindariensis TaxID=478010 RepID=UPI000CEBBC6D|nr:nucleoside deaminase [Microterricola pindariensis]